MAINDWLRNPNKREGTNTGMKSSRSSSTRLKLLLVTVCVLPLLVSPLATAPMTVLARDYAQARNVRTRLGHEAALPLYQQLLRDNPNDVTAATRIAACADTPPRHDAACPCDSKQIRKLRQVLYDSNYDHKHIQTLVGIGESHKLAFCIGPVYLTPVTAGSATDPLTMLSGQKYRSLQCLVSLFLLGIAVPRRVLDECLVGGRESVQLFQELGLAFPCQTDPDLIIPYVHLFPMEVGVDLILATDLHPRVLSCTTVGTRLDGAVMYIGPDSLALVNHLPLPFLLPSSRILDLCAGSGVQALSVLSSLGDHASNALCVDINERALRFVQFNAALNGLAGQVNVRRADLISGSMTCSEQGETVQNSLVKGLRDVALQMNPKAHAKTSSFDLILANPPFIPVPPEDETILQRYGLFSSGGPDGEDVLKVVFQLASALLPPTGGLLGVVSEFMNPPISDEAEGDESLLRRIRAWWSHGPRGRGVLFTNEFPIDAETYGTRRADLLDELDIWLRHLSNLNVAHVSPGLVFICTDESLAEFSTAHEFVPKTASGSLWTPSNRDAVVFTRKRLKAVLHPNATNTSL